MSKGQSEIATTRPSRSVDEVNELLKRLRGEACNLMTSIIKVDRIPPHHEIGVNAVRINPALGAGDVWRDNKWDADVVALTGDALHRLWNAAGGQFADSHPEFQEMNVVEWKCAGKIREMGGAWTIEWCSKRIDLRDGAPETIGVSKGQLEQQRRDIYQLAESKAQSRVIRKMLGVRQKYTIKDVSMPFIFLRPMFIVDMNDPMQKALYMADSMGATAQLFGNPGFMKMLTSGGIPEPDDIDSAPKIEAKEQKSIAGGDTKTAEPAETKQVQPTPSQQKTVFLQLSESNQVEELSRLIQVKGYDTAKLTKTIDKFTAKAREQFFDILNGMPDKTSDDDDLGFKV